MAFNCYVTKHEGFLYKATESEIFLGVYVTLIHVEFVSWSECCDNISTDLVVRWLVEESTTMGSRRSAEPYNVVIKHLTKMSPALYGHSVPVAVEEVGKQGVSF